MSYPARAEGLVNSTLFYCDHQSLHSCAVLQPFQVFAFQPKLSQMFSDAGHRYDILIDIDVYERGCHTPPVSSCTSTMLMIAFRMREATFRLNHKCVKQYLSPSTFKVWNGHSDSWTHARRYTLLRSIKDTLEPFCYNLGSLAVQTSALAVNVSTWWLSSRKSITGRTLDLFCCSMAIRGISSLGSPSFSSGYGTS